MSVISGLLLSITVLLVVLRMCKLEKKISELYGFLNDMVQIMDEALNNNRDKKNESNEKGN